MTLLACRTPLDPQTAIKVGSPIEDCTKPPKGTLNKEQVQPIQLSSQSIDLSGMLQVGMHRGYRFSAQAGQELDYQTNDGICVWIFAPDNRLISDRKLPLSGSYMLQLAVPHGSRTFELSVRLQDQTTRAKPSPKATTLSPKPAPQPKAKARSPVIPTPDPEPTRVEFIQGGTGTTLTGVLQKDQKQQYLLWCAQGQTMSVQVEADDEVRVNITTPNGKTLATIAPTETQWRGNLPSNGDYSIQITGVVTSNYKLTIEVL